MRPKVALLTFSVGTGAARNLIHRTSCVAYLSDTSADRLLKKIASSADRVYPRGRPGALPYR